MPKNQKVIGIIAMLLCIPLLLSSCTEEDDKKDKDDEVVDTGYLDPIAEIAANGGTHVPECTYCFGNTLNDISDADAGTASVLIDHIFIKNSGIKIADMTAGFLYKDLVTLDSGEVTNLSDHYGIKVSHANLSVISYNYGLAYSFVPLAAERLPKLKTVTEGADSDILCMQEVWTSDDAKTMVEAAKTARYPHSYYNQGDDDQFTTAACTSAQLAPVLECGNTSCSSETGSNLTACLASSCLSEAVGLLGTCLEGIYAQVADLTLSTIEAKVTVPSSKYAFNGSNGLVLVSKNELMNTDVKHLTSTTNRRSILYAKIMDSASKPSHLFCTHLTANLSVPHPYAGEGQNWATEQAVQIGVLLDWAEEKGPSEAQYLIGDFNTGVADVANNIGDEVPENYALIP